MANYARPKDGSFKKLTQQDAQNWPHSARLALADGAAKLALALTLEPARPLWDLSQTIAQKMNPKQQPREPN